ncbi:polymorphic toxin type 17 domain-containing protein, partial [Streptomyces anulatus]|uniref:polymorphic toxin type 17 domain-containing protein n=1 Tax=Streptomyces anulatus TaxID=1892 RepID=UPI0036D75B8D
ANKAAAAARESRTAANDAAAHADAAAKAADEAVKYAGQSKDYANQSTKHANAAIAAAKVATDAVAKARTVEETAREAEAVRLRNDLDNSVQVAGEIKKREDAAAAKESDAVAEADRRTTETKELLAAAGAEGAEPAVVAAKGRAAAFHIVTDGGPWSQQAAEAALTGTDADVQEWIRTGYATAVEQDDRARVQHLKENGSAALKAAAEQALAGTHAEVVAFLETGQHTVQADDYRVKVLEMSRTGGTGVKRAAGDAIDAGTTAALLAFLEKGQYTAREEDDRVEALKILQTGGPQTRAAAQVALAGPARMLRDFVGAVQYRTAQQDSEQAAHVAGVRKLIAEGARAAALANQDASRAAEAAAKARNAAVEAAGHAQDAKDSAAKAAGFASDAAKSADDAEASAQRARASAARAKSAAATANQAAAAAGESAHQAAASASRAAASADYAYGQAAAAAASAVAAGKSAAEAAKAAGEALKSALDKLIEELKEQGEEPSPVEGDGQKDYPAPDEDLEGEGGLSAADKAKLVLDITGMFDPTPVSDGSSGLISLFQGDFAGAGLSLAAFIPYVGDALAKPAKFAKYLDEFEHLAKYVDDLDWVGNAIKSVKHLSPSQYGEALSKMNKLAGDSGKAYKNKNWLATAKKYDLPTDGPIPYVPPKGWDPKRPQVRGGGFPDKYGNIWTRAKDGKDEWDVQIPKGKGFETFAGSKNQGKDYSHANISKKGYVTH